MHNSRLQIIHNLVEHNLHNLKARNAGPKEKHRIKALALQVVK